MGPVKLLLGLPELVATVHYLNGFDFLKILCGEFSIYFITIGFLLIYFNFLYLIISVSHLIFLGICNHKNLNSLDFLEEGIKVCIGTEMFKCCFRKFAVSCENF